ncbi:MAG: HTH-type transcriptional repressor CytR [Anaerolineae bacterium]|mgnify:CR=1 FL=1|nr:HTH-type transcriptional repressor CytR [Anaerolineae bacterium]
MASQSRLRETRRATIKDVAHAAGVSVTTVSNALNGRTEAMTEETLQRIQQTIRALNYRPSRVARSLVTQHTATIGVIITEIVTPLFLQALNDIESIARDAEHNILLATTADKLEEEAQVFDLLLEKQVDGIIFLSTSVYTDNSFLENLPSSVPPIVLINRTNQFHSHFDQINFDNINGIRQAVDYLVQLGHRYIGHLVGPANRASSAERLSGYLAALEKHQLLYGQDYVRPGDFEKDPLEWEASTRELLALSPRPTAIIAANDRVAAIVMRTVQRAGLRIPEDISIIGIDNQPFCTYLNPMLTTIQLPISEAGRQATRMLLARIENPRQQTHQEILACPLIVRESTGAAAM